MFDLTPNAAAEQVEAIADTRDDTTKGHDMTTATRVTLTVTVDLPDEEWSWIHSSINLTNDHAAFLRQLAGWDVKVSTFDINHIDDDGEVVETKPEGVPAY